MAFSVSSAYNYLLIVKNSDEICFDELDANGNALSFSGEEYDRQYEEADKLGYCIALYDYETTEEGELPLREGQVVRIMRKIVHDGIDDGWWEGEADGRVGLFPSLMVQDCSEDGRPLDFDDVSARKYKLSVK